MAANQSLVSASNKISAVSSTLITNEDEAIMLPLATSAALDDNPAAAAPSSFMESNLGRVQTAMAGAQYNSIDRSARQSSRELNPSLLPCTNDIDHTSTHSCTPIHDVRCKSGLKRKFMDRAAVQLQVPAPVDNKLELVALQDDDGEHCMSSITKAHEMQSPSMKLHASKEGRSTEKVEVDRKHGEVDQEEGEVNQEGAEEEGCETPTARDQRIPQYTVELNTSGLVCPPAPKKKPNCASKRRRLFYSTNDAGPDVNYNYQERRAFLVDPPDLHNFPDCIRALFK